MQEGETGARRVFLKTVATGLGALGFWRSGGIGLAGPGAVARDAVTAKLLESLRHRESAVLVGREYLRIVPSEGDTATLVELVCSSTLEAHRWVPDQNLEALGEWLRARQQDDFVRGRTVRVHGWVLSVTEARLCAVAALV